MGKLRVFSSRGDDEVAWTQDDPASETIAREVFEAKLSAGCAAFKKLGNGEHELTRTFDPSADEILITKPGAGG